MSLLAVPGARPIAPARATRPRRALVSASVVSKKSTDAVGRARVVSRVSCRPTGRRAVRVSCRASADAGDADDEALPWKPTSILADLTSGDGPTETERRPNRASSDETRATATRTREDARRDRGRRRGAVRGGVHAPGGGLSRLAAPANASSSATASSSTLVGSVTAESVKSKTSGFASTFATYKEYSAGEIFAYEAQKVFALPLLGKVACLFVLTIPIVFLGGLGYKLVDVLDGRAATTRVFAKSSSRRTSTCSTSRARTRRRTRTGAAAS